MQIKTRLRFLLTPVRMASTSIKNNTSTNVGEEAGKKELSYTAGRNIN
jgi:hypothetical protein